MEEKKCCANCGLSICDLKNPPFYICIEGKPEQVKADYCCKKHIYEDDYIKSYYGIKD